MPKALAAREAGAKVTDIAQIFQRSGTLQVSFKDKAITSAADFKGKKIGNWGFGNEYEIFAALSKGGSTRPRTSRCRPAVRHQSACSTATSTPPRR